jgi:hypothetical protein
MSSDDVQTGRDELQFDRVETSGEQPGERTTGPDVTCVVCGKSVGSAYYHINDKPVCESCRQTVLAAAVTPRTAGPLLRAGLFGLAAAIAGAAIYYAVIAITNFEIGLVAVLIGYMVGFMVRKGAGGRGGRRFQILAVVLTYWAVGLAYTPLAFKGMTEGKRDAADSTSMTSADSVTASVPAPSTDSATVATAVGETEDVSGTSALKAIGGLVVLVFALPVMSVLGSLPGGLLSALIILFGLLQAWTMTRAHALDVSGPYKVGSGPTPANP